MAFYPRAYYIHQQEASQPAQSYGTVFRKKYKYNSITTL